LNKREAVAKTPATWRRHRHLLCPVLPHTNAQGKLVPVTAASFLARAQFFDAAPTITANYPARLCNFTQTRGLNTARDQLLCT
jgi:hypothetical protein